LDGSIVACVFHLAIRILVSFLHGLSHEAYRRMAAARGHRSAFEIADAPAAQAGIL